MSEKSQSFVAAPIILGGLFISLTIGYSVGMRSWAAAATLFCYGITLLGARLAQLIARRTTETPRDE